jgi:hypothetical protein
MFIRYLRVMPFPRFAVKKERIHTRETVTMTNPSPNLMASTLIDCIDTLIAIIYCPRIINNLLTSVANYG